MPEAKNTHAIAKRQKDPGALTVQKKKSETPAEAVARTSLQPCVQAAATLWEFNRAFGELSLDALVRELSAECERSGKESLRKHEAILTAQAHTLDAIFNVLARRASRVDGDVCRAEGFLRLAFKAQSQCRTTIEALSEIRNPRAVAFVRQANIAKGAQQVNNELAEGRTRAEIVKTGQNKVLEHDNGQRLDSKAAYSSSQVDTRLEALGKVDRTQDARRKSGRRSQRI